MSQHIVITIDGQNWFDGDVDSVEMRKDSGGVQVVGKVKGVSSGGGGLNLGSFAERIAGKSAQKTQDMVADKRADLAKKAEKSEG